MTSLNILDTGDNYILAMNNDNYNDAVKLYELLDITVNTIPTNLNVSKDTCEFIYNSIGKVVSYGFVDNNNTDILAKLLGDIQKTVEYYKIKDFWSGLQYPSKQLKYDESKMLPSTENSLISSSDYNSAINNAKPLTYDKLLPDDFKSEFKNNQINENIINELSSKMNVVSSLASYLHVFYNTIYNISLVVDDSFINNTTKLSNDFPEFIIVKSINTITSECKDHFIKLFNKVSYSNISDLRSRIDAFLKLYDIPQATVNSENHGEKKRVKEFLDWNYTLSTDIDRKMKANDIYKEIINFLCIPLEDASAFKKRLAGYLLEFNLQKKRYSDAYYYYGIEKKTTVSNVSLSDIEEKRASDKNTWFQTVPKINRLEAISTRKDFTKNSFMNGR